MSAGLSAGAVAVIGAGLVGSMMASSAASNAANTQSAAAIQAAQLQAQTTAATNAQQLGIYNQNVAMQQPWIQSGQAGNAALQQYMGTAPSTGGANYGQGAAQPTLADMTGAMNPMYQFQVDQGQQQLQASAAARGGLLTGQGAKDIVQYGQNAAGAGLQQGYNNYVNNQNNLYTRLSNISTTGQNAAAGVGAQGTTVGGNMANVSMAGTAAQNAFTTQGANAQAGGMVNSANAWNSGINSGVKNVAYLNSLNGQQQPTTTPAPAPVDPYLQQSFGIAPQAQVTSTPLQ
jgi:hypothetical protein